ncbi:Major royal jelly protein/protein yellow [Sergentomyia squamirostris]
MQYLLFSVTLSTFSIFIARSYPNNSVEEVFKWKRVEFESLPKSENSWVGPFKYFIPENNDIMGMAYHPISGLMIVTIARLRPGVPITVAAFCVSDFKTGSSPKFWPFPNYKTNEIRPSDFYGFHYYDDYEGRKHGKNPNKNQNHLGFYDWNQNYYHHSHHKIPAYQKPLYQTPLFTTPAAPNHKPSSEKVRIISVYSVNVDEKCNRAYFVDTGLLPTSTNYSIPVQKPALYFYNISPDCCENRKFDLIRRAEIPDRLVSKIPFGLLYVTLDFQSEDCEDIFLYCTNFFGSYLVVYDYRKNEFWSFTDHPTLEPVVSESYMIYEKSFNYQLLGGIINIVLGYKDEYGDKVAYYVDAAGTGQYAVSAKVLKDKTKSGTQYNINDFQIMGYRGCDSQTARMVVDYTFSVVFYAELQSNRITCWNMKKPLNPDNIGIVFESENLKYPLQIFIDSRGYLWFNSGRIPIIYFSTQPLNLNIINDRFYRVRVRDAIHGTVCEDDNYYKYDI